MVKVLFKGGQWTNAEDEVLKSGVMKYGKMNWGRIASLITRKTADQCKARWTEWLDPDINRSEWTHEEEAKLLDLVQAMPSMWRSIADQMPGRTAAQCLERHEMLLDRARGEAAEAGKQQGIRLGEQDQHWESKPARADAVDMDSYEQDMLDAARGRLANTKGKKELRKERERKLAENRRRQQLQKERELREAGIDVGKSKAMADASKGAGVLGVAAVAGDGDLEQGGDDDGDFVAVRTVDVDGDAGGRKRREGLSAGDVTAPQTTRQAIDDGAAKAFSFDAPIEGATTRGANNQLMLIPVGKRATAAAGALTSKPSAAAGAAATRPAKMSRAEAPKMPEPESLSALPSLPSLPKKTTAPTQQAASASTSGLSFAQMFNAAAHRVAPAARLQLPVSLPPAASRIPRDVAERLVADEVRAAAPAPRGVATVDSVGAAGTTQGALSLSEDDPRRAALAAIDDELCDMERAAEHPAVAALLHKAPRTREETAAEIQRLRAVHAAAVKRVADSPACAVATAGWMAAPAAAMDVDDARRVTATADDLASQQQIALAVYGAVRDAESFVVADRVQRATAAHARSRALHDELQRRHAEGARAARLRAGQPTTS